MNREESARICKNLQESTSIYENIIEYATLGKDQKNLQESDKICQGVSGYS